MQTFTDARDDDEDDELWFTEHPPVFTLGVNADRSHLLAPGDIPVVQIDRGGQVTYHGPGQLMIYPLISLKRAGLGVRDLVTALEQSVVDLLKAESIDAMARCDAPGVYVSGCKIASVGLRIRRGCSFHGMALNVDVNREHFSRINPCGMAGLDITDLEEQIGVNTVSAAEQLLLPHLLRHLRMTDRTLSHSDRLPSVPVEP